MYTKTKLLTILFFIFSFVTNAQNPISDLEKDFNDFKNKEKKAFDDYKKKENEAIAAFLKEEWKAYEKNKAEPYPFKPVPINIPVNIPKPIEQPDLDKLPIIKPNPKNDDTEKEEEIIEEPENKDDPKVKDEDVEIAEENKHEDDKDLSSLEEADGSNNTENETENNDANNSSSSNSESNLTYLPTSFSSQSNLNYYGENILFGFEQDLLLKCKTPDEKGVAEYWVEISKKNYVRFANQLQWIKAKNNLNDWATYQLIKNISENLLANKNDQVCFQFFFLNQLMYDIRLAKTNNELVLMIPIKETTYGMSYLEINNKKYYLTKDGNSSYYTFAKELIKDQKEFSLMIDEPILFNSNREKKVFRLKSDKEITIDYNLNMISFYKDYPQADLEVLFNSKPSTSMTQSIQQEFTPQLAGMNEWDAVNFLLNFVQHQFKYKTDGDQFGKEKWFFPEDQLHYPYSDCEDRSVFFAYLVKKLLNLEVIGLNYPEHVAVAVNFHGNVNGDAVRYKGKDFIICDPTYIGASAGMCMPQFKTKSPKVVEVFND